MKKWIMSVGVVLGLGVLIYTIGFAGKEKKVENVVKPHETAVEIYELIKKPWASTLKREGSVHAENMYFITADTGGKLIKMNVKEGQKVNRGDLLFELDQEQLQMNLSAKRANESVAKAGYESANAIYKSALLDASLLKEQYEEAVKEHERSLNLYASGAISRVERDQANLLLSQTKVSYEKSLTAVAEKKAALLSASAGVKVAGEEVKESDYQLRHAKITAPVAGYVSSIHASLGQNVGGDQVLCQIQDLSAMKVEIKLSQTERGHFNVGDTAKVSIEGLKEIFHGTITEMGTSLDGESKDYRCLLSIENANEKLHEGMFAEVTLTGAQKVQSLILPSQCVLTQDEKAYVLVEENGKCKRYDVSEGETDNGYVQILSGLSEHQRVIASNLGALRENDIVHEGK